MLELALWPDSILEKKIEPVTEFDEELKFLSDVMFETMYHHKGVGLAASQVNLEKRMLVIDVNEPLVLCNPVVVMSNTKTAKESESCLSFPGFLVDVERPIDVVVTYDNLDGEKSALTVFEGLGARAVQHEIDHLDGITFLRYISKHHRDLITSKMRKKK